MKEPKILTIFSHNKTGGKGNKEIISFDKTIYLKDYNEKILEDYDIIILCFVEDYDSYLQKKLCEIYDKCISMNKIVYNNPYHMMNILDKLKFMDIFRDKHYIPKYKEVLSRKDLNFYKFPVIIALTETCCGKGRFKCNNINELHNSYEKLKAINKNNQRIFIAEFIDTYDNIFECTSCTRLVHINNTIIDVLCRCSANNEWNIHNKSSNLNDKKLYEFHMRVKEYVKVNKYVQEYINDCHKIFGNGFYVSDCYISEDEFVVFEINYKHFDDAIHKKFIKNKYLDNLTCKSYSEYKAFVKDFIIQERITNSK